MRHVRTPDDAATMVDLTGIDAMCRLSRARGRVLTCSVGGLEVVGDGVVGDGVAECVAVGHRRAEMEPVPDAGVHRLGVEGVGAGVRAFGHKTSTVVGLEHATGPPRRKAELASCTFQPPRCASLTSSRVRCVERVTKRFKILRTHV